MLAMMGLLLILSCVVGINGWQIYSRPAVAVEWTTASELDTVGFNLYRGLSPDGPFEKVNEHFIPPAEDPLVGGDYSFVDHQVIAGQHYYYWLEDVDQRGINSRHGPIEVIAKREWLGLVQVIVAILIPLAVLLAWYVQAKHKSSNEIL